MAHNQVMFTSEGFEKRMILNEIFLKGWLAIAKLKPLSLFISLF